MATLNFFIEGNLNKKVYLIYVRYDHKGQKTLISTGTKAEKDQINWVTDGVRKKIKTSQPLNKKYTGYLKANEDLIKTYLKVQDSMYAAKEEGDQRPTRVKEIFKGIGNHTEVKSIIEGIDEMLKYFSNSLEKKSLHNYDKNLRKHIIGFNDWKSRTQLLSDLDRKFELEFKAYLKGDGLTKSTIDNQIKYLKSLCKKLGELGIGYNPKVFDFKREKLNNPVIYLSNQELKKLETGAVNSSKELAEQKDVFVFQCHTGLRFGDLKRFGKSMVDDQNRIVTLSEKTNTKIQIPMSKMAISIAEKYNYNLPTLSNQNYNKAIHKFMEELNFDRTVEEKDDRPLYEVCSTHMARKTFISYSLNTIGLTSAEISLITGTSIDTIHKHYAGADLREVERKMKRPLINDKPVGSM